ncbi:ABC transporter ATP-binding protein [Ammoniphilus sp. CFH 90114]|uniref:ABC transporter ATP-binding protein n=1 Tax=Ammoniphilus sp. CFH 90114 TaxID=2493665 RepID=UPI00100E52CD|nr:ABC transporter ATP-binding protein [Ammoniphilus sp. CFH 90114]RXT04293.1 ABC transporter ATP-binding protein [Ammoniphilus sp. CFH 90114]
MAPILEVRNLKTTFKQSRSSITVVDGVDFTLEPGETLGIVGESGCGKSVTSLSIMRLLGKNAVTDGTIAFEGKNLLALSEKEMKKVRGNRVAMIFQEPMTSLNPLHSVGKQISEPLRNHLGLSKAQAKERTIQLLNAVGIPRADEIFSSYPHQLSGGMRQRVMIAMAMACQPKLIIADEPTTALDVTIQAQILELMKKLKKDNGTSIVMITHDLGVVAEMCERVIVMYAGQVVEEADIRTLFRSPKHPYTIGLMKSMPDFTEDQDRLQAIPGTVPLLSDLPKGCRFAPRCEWATDRCHQAAPELISVTEQHRVRCVLVEEEKA